MEKENADLPRAPFILPYIFCPKKHLSRKNFPKSEKKGRNPKKSVVFRIKSAISRKKVPKSVHPESARIAICQN